MHSRSASPAALPENHTADHESTEGRRHESTEGRRHGNIRRKLCQTAALYLGRSTVGFFLCLVGPSLLDLQITANTDTKSIALVFIGRAIGGATGAVLFALVFAKCHPWNVLGAAYAGMGAALAVMPWMGHIVAVTVVYALGGMAFCISDAGLAVMLMSIWGLNNGPWIQAFAALFFIGCTFAPMLVNPFLSSQPTGSEGQCYGVKAGTYNSNLTSLMSTIPPAATTVDTHDNGVDIWKPFMIAGGILSISAVVFVAVGCATWQKPRKHSVDKKDRLKKQTEKSEPGQIVFLGLIASFIFLYTCMQRGINSFLLTYAVHCLGWAKGDAAYLKTAYQASAFCARSLGIIAVMFVSAAKLMAVLCVANLAAVVVMVTFGGHVTAMWLSTVCIGISGSPMYGYCLTWGSQYIRYTGNVGAVFTMMGALSDLVGPLVINLLYDHFGLATFPYYVLVLSVAMVIFYGLIALNTVSRTRLDRIPQVSEIGEEVELPLKVQKAV